ncbi:hypothetical protein ISF79_01530 [Burkholderia pseudomallei]|nr:hypothetical protein [Burkholderia pseudomallei]
MEQIDDTQYAPVQFSVIRGLLKRKHVVARGVALSVVLLGAWLGFRTGFVDLYPIAVVLGVFTYFVMSVAIEVVELVAETLMPR